MTQYRTVRDSAVSNERVLTALQRCRLVDGLKPEQVARIAAGSSLHRVTTQRQVFDEGDESEGLWVLTSGRVRLHHLMADGRQQVVGFRAPTTPLDLAAALDGRPYMETATATEDTELVLVPRALLPELAERYPVTVRNAIDLLCLEVRQRDICGAIGAVKDARGRIGCALLQLVREFGRRRGDVLRIEYRLTRQDIADRSGVTVETAIRVMSDLQQRGVIRTQARIIELLDVEAVREMAACPECQFECSVFALANQPAAAASI